MTDVVKEFVHIDELPYEKQIERLAKQIAEGRAYIPNPSRDAIGEAADYARYLTHPFQKEMRGPHGEVHLAEQFLALLDRTNN